MMFLAVCCLCLLGPGVLAGLGPQRLKYSSGETEESLYAVPDGLLIGAGISATQSEGAWNVSGKAESAMDFVVHAQTTQYLETNEVSSDHYHKYKEDLAMAKQMGLTSHRFSISWSRIFPDGNASAPNDEAVQFYKDYIKEVRKNGMEPLVTMHHFDHPLVVEKATGGWASKKMVDKFVEYATYLFTKFPEVKYWNPINEGNMYCIYLLPRLNATNMTPTDNSSHYKCLHNTILAHAKVYRKYKDLGYKGQVGSSVLIWVAYPLTTKPEDVMAANTWNDVFGGTMIHPLVHGDYPPIAKYLIEKRSKEALGMTESRLPEFTPEEKELLKGGPLTDFVALNVYSGMEVEYAIPAKLGPVPSLFEPINYDMPFVSILQFHDDFDETLMRAALLWTWNSYHLPIVITENGLATADVGVKDTDRTAYHSSNMRSLVRTMKEFGIPVISYHAWTLMDAFEFTAGYAGRPFGLIQVDYENKTLARTLKESSKFFIEVAQTKHVPYYLPSSAPTNLTGLLHLALAAVLIGLRNLTEL